MNRMQGEHAWVEGKAWANSSYGLTSAGHGDSKIIEIQDVIAVYRSGERSLRLVDLNNPNVIDFGFVVEICMRRLYGIDSCGFVECLYYVNLNTNHHARCLNRTDPRPENGFRDFVISIDSLCELDRLNIGDFDLIGKFIANGEI